jgi:glyoxylase-like metal-dependent hydrolase (beta-lactamase superfamily II)
MARAVSLALLHLHGKNKPTVDLLVAKAKDLNIDLSTKTELKVALAQFLNGQQQQEAKTASATETKGEDKQQPLKPVVQCMPHMDTFTCVYIVSCPTTKQAVIIDSALDYDQPSSTISYKVRSLYQFSFVSWLCLLRLVQHANAVIAEIEKRSLKVQAVIETHARDRKLSLGVRADVFKTCCAVSDADHLTAALYLRDHFKCKVVIGADIVQVQKVFGNTFNLDEKELPRDGSQFDELYKDGQKWKLGEIDCEVRCQFFALLLTPPQSVALGVLLQVIATPGHTPACMSWVIGDAIFCGDTLFMPDIGTARCGELRVSVFKVSSDNSILTFLYRGKKKPLADFPGGSVEQMWTSVQRLLAFPDNTRLFVGHDYPPTDKSRELRWETSVAEQKASNKMVKTGTKKVCL